MEPFNIKVFCICFTSSLALLSLVKADFTLHIIYAELQPFVYKKDNGEVHGIIPKQYEQAVKICRTLSNKTFHLVYVHEESFDILHENLLQKNKTLEDLYTDLNMPNYNVTQLALTNHAPFLFPFFMGQHENGVNSLSSRGIVNPELLKTHQIAMIMHRKNILLIRKAINSVISSFGLAFRVILFVIVITITMTFIENYDKFKRGISWSALCLTAWFTVVTCTSVGYGDYVPKTKIGKVIGFLWIGVSLILVSIYTAVISGTVFTNADALIEDSRISVLKYSYEAEIVAKNYPKADIVPKKSYLEVIQSVIDDDAIAGFLNGDYGAWIQDELRKKHVHIVHLLDYEISVNGLTTFERNTDYLHSCMQKHEKDIIERPVTYFRKECEPEKVYYDSIVAFYQNNSYIPVITAIILLFAVFGIGSELFTDRKLCLYPAFRQCNKKEKTQICENVIHNSDLEKYILSISSDVKQIKDTFK